MLSELTSQRSAIWREFDTLDKLDSTFMGHGGKRPGAGRPKGYKFEATRVREAVTRERMKNVGITAQRVLDELALHSFGNVQDLFDEHGNLKPIQSMDRHQAALIASFEVIKKNAEAGDGKTDIIHKVRVWDKVKSLEMLAKHFALLVERVEVSGADTLFAKLAAGRERNAQRQSP